MTNDVIIDGGHYPLEQRGNEIIHKPNALTVLAFQLAVKLYIKALNQNIKASLGFLVNDMGLDFDSRKYIKKKLYLHPVYADILKQNNITQFDITCVFYESTLRNRASRQILKEGIKKGKVKTFESLLYVPDISDTNKEASHANYVGNHVLKPEAGNMLNPFCRAIMAQKLFDSEALAFNKMITFISEHEFLCLGEFAKVYHVLGGKNNVLNVLLSCFELNSREKVSYGLNYFEHHSKVYYLKNTKSPCFIQTQYYNKR